MSTEQVFAVRRADFFGGDWPQGFVPAAALGALPQQLGRAGRFLDRPDAERDPTHKQLIPYCVLRRPHEVFCVERTAGQTERRLHHLLSIGIGGHINPMPGADPTTGLPFFEAALWQELEEELAWRRPRPVAPHFLGMLNDDGQAVGQVHAGLVFALDLPAATPDEQTPYVRETTKMRGGFRHLAELEPLWQDPCRFESWSRILFTAGIAGSRAVLPGSIPICPDGAERNTTHG